MKVPLTWLKDYVKVEKSHREIAASFTQLGLMLDKPLDDSGVLDLEHRMDRSDWLSIVGVARDLAAFENLPLLEPKLHIKTGLKPNSQNLIAINIETPHVRRFNTRVFRGIKVGESPAWLKERLSAYGIEPKNNLVDITNFVMVELGQPMHAQDLAKLKGPDITIRAAKKGEKIITLLGTEVRLDPDTFVLTSGGEVTVIGGIVGGKNTGVTAATTDIILDAGNYDQSIVRRTSRRLKLVNETVSRYDKFLDPRLCQIALARATGLILELCGGTYYENVDYYPYVVEPKTQKLTLARLKLISGLELNLKDIKRILKALGYEIVEEREQSLTLEIPYFRTDIEVEDDLIADILRISNYQNIPLAPLSTPVPPAITPPIYNFEEKLRDLLVALGAHEHISSSLIKSSGANGEVLLANALSADQNALRTSLIPGLKLINNNYRKHGKSAPLFEIGLVFTKIEGEYRELRHINLLGESYLILASLLSSLQIKYQINNLGQILVGSQIIGTLDSSSFTLYVDLLSKFASPYQPLIHEFTHASSRDISLLVPDGVTYFDLTEALSKLPSHWQDMQCISVDKLKNQTNYLLRFTWNDTSHLESDKKLILAKFKEMGWESRSG